MVLGTLAGGGGGKVLTTTGRLAGNGLEFGVKTLGPALDDVLHSAADRAGLVLKAVPDAPRMEGYNAANSDVIAGKTFNRKAIIEGFQDHHIISHTNALTKNHELLELSGFNLQARSNKIFLPESADLHPTRSIHLGRHTNSVSQNLANQMDTVVDVGQQQGWSQQQYRQALDAILAQERAALKAGDRALNKNARP